MSTTSIPDPQTYRVDRCGGLIVVFGLAGEDLALQAGKTLADAEPDRDVVVIHGGRVLIVVARSAEFVDPENAHQVEPLVLSWGDLETKTGLANPCWPMRSGD